MICCQFEKAEIERVIIYQTNNNIRYKIHIQFLIRNMLSILLTCIIYLNYFYWYHFGSKIAYNRIKSALYKELFIHFISTQTQFCVLLNPCNIYIIWLFIQLFLVLFYIPNLLRIFCTHFGVTVSTY